MAWARQPVKLAQEIQSGLIFIVHMSDIHEQGPSWKRAE